MPPSDPWTVLGPAAVFAAVVIGLLLVGLGMAWVASHFDEPLHRK